MVRQGIGELRRNHHFVVLETDHGVDGRPSDEDTVQDRGKGIDVGPCAGGRLDAQLLDGGVAREHFGREAAVDHAAFRNGEVGDAHFMVGIDVQGRGGNAPVDDAVLVERRQGGEDGHEQDPGLFPGQEPFLGSQQVVPQGLRAFDIFTDGIGRVVLFKDVHDRDEGGQTVHLLELAPEFEERAEEAVVRLLGTFADEKRRGVRTSADHGVRQELADGDRSFRLSVVAHVSGAVAVGFRDCADEIVAADDGPHGEERGQLQRVVMEVTVRALLRRSFFLHAVHA